MCCPCFQRIPFSELVCCIQLLCGVLVSKGSFSQNMSVVFNSCVVSLLPKDPVLRTCLLYSTLVWCLCFQRIPFLELVCYTQRLCGVLAFKGSRSQNLSVAFNSCAMSLFPKDPVLRTCLLYLTLVCCPCFQRIPFAAPVCCIQLLCGVHAAKESRSQSLSVIFNSCVVSLLPKDPVLRTCLLYSTLVWFPCLKRISFSEPVCFIHFLSGVTVS